MLFSINRLFFFRTNFESTYLKKYKFRSLGRAFVYKLDFELFVTAQSSRLLREKWDFDFSPKSYYIRTVSFLSYCDTLIDFKSKLTKLKLKKTIILNKFDSLNQDNLFLFKKNLYKDEDNDILLNYLSDVSQKEVRLKLARICDIKYKYLGENARVLQHWTFRPPLYDEPLFLERMLRFKKRPHYKHRRLAMIDRYNYHLIIKFLYYHLRKKLKFLEKNLKIFEKIFKIFYKKYFIKYFKYFKVFYKIFLKNLKYLKKFKKYFLDNSDYKLILLEYRKLQMGFFSFKYYINKRFFILNKYFIFLRNDLSFYLVHLTQLFKRSKKYRFIVNELMRIYHVGFQYIYKKIKQFFFDFFIIIKIMLRDFYLVTISYWRHLSFFKKVCKKVLLRSMTQINHNYIFYYNYFFNNFYLLVWHWFININSSFFYKKK